jgi:hypothetical protein
MSSSLYNLQIDDTYTLAYTVTAANGLDADYHEASITPQGSMLITAYAKTPWNLTTHGRQNGYIWDCVFQEIEIASNKLIYEWRASEHFKFEDMAVSSWTSWTGKFPLGSSLVSSS